MNGYNENQNMEKVILNKEDLIEAAGGNDIEYTYFDVRLLSYGTNDKLPLIRVVRTVTGLGFKEAVDIVDSVPSTIANSVLRDEADDIRNKLVAAGGTVLIVGMS